MKLSIGFAIALSLSAETIAVDGLRAGYATGADLAGLEVTTVWQFSSGPFSLTRIWEATGPDSGEAAYALDWLPYWPPMLAMAGDSRTAVWTYEGLYADPILSIMVDGRAAGIFFEKVMLPVASSYSNPVSIGGRPPDGTLFATLWFGGRGSFSFIQPVVLATPEPGSMALAGVGMALALLLGRRLA